MEKQTKVTILPLKAIGPYTPATFTIEGKIIHVEPIKTIQTRRRTKSFFYIVLADVNGTSMKINFWESQAVLHFGKFKKEELYQFSNLKVYEPTNPAFAIYGSIELNFQNHTKFVKINETKSFILPQYWRFIDGIQDIVQKSENEKIDVVGMVFDVGDEHEVTVGRDQKRRKTTVKSFKLIDQTGKVTVSCWGDKSKIQLQQYQIIAIKKARVTNYGGKTLTVLGHIEKKPKHVKVTEINLWKQSQNAALEQLIKATKSVTDESKMNVKHDYSNAKVTTVSEALDVRDAYHFTTALPEETFFIVPAKIKKINNNMFFQKEKKFHWRLKIQISDPLEQENQIWATAFQTAATKIMNNLSPQAAIKMQEQDNERFTNLITSKFNAEIYNFHLYCKENEWNEIKRLDFIIEDVEKQ